MDAVTGPTKTQLRAEILLARRTLAPQLHDAEAHALSGRLPALIGAGETVCAYVPVGSEPGSAELIDSLLRREVRVLLPIARHDAAGTPVPLQWGEYRPGGLVEARFGLREPAASRQDLGPQLRLRRVRHGVHDDSLFAGAAKRTQRKPSRLNRAADTSV